MAADGGRSFHATGMLVFGVDDLAEKVSRGDSVVRRSYVGGGFYFVGSLAAVVASGVSFLLGYFCVFGRGRGDSLFGAVCESGIWKA